MMTAKEARQAAQNMYGKSDWLLIKANSLLAAEKYTGKGIYRLSGEDIYIEKPWIFVSKSALNAAKNEIARETNEQDEFDKHSRKIEITIPGEIILAVYAEQEKVMRGEADEYAPNQVIAEWICSQNTLDLEFEITNAILDI